MEAPLDLFVSGIDTPSHMIRGRIDAVYVDADATIELVDFKTGRTPAKGDPSAETQILIYAVAASDAFRYAPEQIRGSFVYLQADGTEALSVPVDITPDRIDQTRSWLHETVARIDAGPSGTNPGPWGQRRDFHHVCPAAV